MIIKCLILLFVFLYLNTFRLNLNSLATANIVCGLPGAGKTTALAAYTAQFSKRKKKVYSNVPVAGAIPYDWKKEFGDYDMSGGLICLDEAGLEADCRDFKNFKKSATEYLKLLRHRHNVLIAFSQTWDDADKKIKDMCGQIWICRRGFLPGVSLLIPVNKKIDVDPDQHQLTDMYYLKHPVLRFFVTKRIYRPLYYKMFDSYEAPYLPPLSPREPYKMASKPSCFAALRERWTRNAAERKFVESITGDQDAPAPVLDGKGTTSTTVHKCTVSVHKYNDILKKKK